MILDSLWKSRELLSVMEPTDLIPSTVGPTNLCRRSGRILLDPSHLFKITHWVKIFRMDSAGSNRLLPEIVDNCVGATQHSDFRKTSSVSSSIIEDLSIKISALSDFIWWSFEQFFIGGSLRSWVSSPPFKFLDFHWFNIKFKEELCCLSAWITWNSDERIKAFVDAC